MELHIGKTCYKTNEYLNTGKNSSGLIGLSNIDFLKHKYSFVELNNLKDFTSYNNSYMIDRTLEHKFKRPKIIILKMDNNIMFIRDDLFSNINTMIQKDPVLDYKTYNKIEKETELTVLKNMYNNYSEILDYNTFEKIYFMEKVKGNVLLDFDESLTIKLLDNSQFVKFNKNTTKLRNI